MSIVQELLGKSVADLSFQAIESYFTDERIETDRLEFKTYRARNDDEHVKAENKIIEAISSFLNSSGGLVIWGAAEGEKRDVGGKWVKVFKGALQPVTKEIEKDSFIRRMASLIIPTPSRVQFHPLKDNTSSTPSFIYLIEVEQSPYSPHQFDKKYFMRLDGVNHPAPHHYLEALFRKITYPNLTGKILHQHCTKVGDNTMRIMFMIEIHNLTAYQNEENLYIRVAHPNAIRNSYGHRMLPGMTNNKINDVFSHHNVSPLLFHGESLETSLFLDYNLSTRGMVQIISLFFGGKKSPLKRTTLKFYWNFNDYLNPVFEIKSYELDEFVSNDNEDS